MVLLMIVLLLYSLGGVVAFVAAGAELKWPKYYQKEIQKGVHWQRTLDLKPTILFLLACGPLAWILFGLIFIFSRVEKILND